MLVPLVLGVSVLILAFAAASIFNKSGLTVPGSMESIHASTAKSAEEQYFIALRHGTAMDACVQAQSVSASYLLAKNEDRYRHWKETEKEICTRAGLSR
jgi:hypothetical protein